MSELYLSSAYLAPVEYYAIIAQFDEVYVDPYDNYIKQTYRNRTEILDPSGKLALTIPIEKKSMNRTAMKDVRISDHNNWQHVHWNAIVSSYNSSPFFEYYLDDFHPLFHKEQKYLYDFNMELHGIVMDLLNLDRTKLKETKTYKEISREKEIDLRASISPKKDLGEVCKYELEPYYQVFSKNKEFVPSLSIIDLLFNMGNESIFTLLNTKINI